MPAVTSLQAQTANKAALEAATANLSRVIRAAGLGARTSLVRIGIGIVNDVKREVSTRGTGRQYGAHRASSPGSPPAVDTGRYRASWTFVIHGCPTGFVGGGSPTLFVGTPSPIGGFLEFGTRRMAPRPHLRPVIRRFEGRIPAIVVEEVTRAQRSAAGSLRAAFGVGRGLLS